MSEERRTPYSAWEDIHPWWTLWFIVVHRAGFVGIWYAITIAHAYTIAFAVVYYVLSHLAITCGLHRLYAHVSYRATSVLHYTWLVLGVIPVEGPALWWSGKHRDHHLDTDGDGDPHSPRRGFWWAHMGWMCTNDGISAPSREALRFSKEHRPFLTWQAKHYWKLTVLMGIVVPAGVPWLWGDMSGGILVVGFARLMVQYHLTWIVNSLCHMHGEEVRNGGSARDIGRGILGWILALLTVGESLHGSHHAAESDWRIGRRWYDPDPGKWVIWLCFKLGLAKPRTKRAA